MNNLATKALILFSVIAVTPSNAKEEKETVTAMDPDEMIENVEIFYDAITKDKENTYKNLKDMYEFGAMLESRHLRSESVMRLVAKLYELSASMIPAAALRLGWLYDYSYVPGDEERNKIIALHWYKQSANAGHIVGLYNWAVASLEYEQMLRSQGLQLAESPILLNGDSACETILRLYEGRLLQDVPETDKDVYSLIQFYSRQEVRRHFCAFPTEHE